MKSHVITATSLKIYNVFGAFYMNADTLCTYALELLFNKLPIQYALLLLMKMMMITNLLLIRGAPSNVL